MCPCVKPWNCWVQVTSAWYLILPRPHGTIRSLWHALALVHPLGDGLPTRSSVLGLHAPAYGYGVDPPLDTMHPGYGVGTLYVTLQSQRVAVSVVFVDFGAVIRGRSHRVGGGGALCTIHLRPRRGSCHFFIAHDHPRRTWQLSGGAYCRYCIYNFSRWNQVFDRRHRAIASIGTIPWGDFSPRVVAPCPARPMKFSISQTPPGT